MHYLKFPAIWSYHVRWKNKWKSVVDMPVQAGSEKELQEGRLKQFVSKSSVGCYLENKVEEKKDGRNWRDVRIFSRHAV